VGRRLEFLFCEGEEMVQIKGYGLDYRSWST